MVTVKNDPTSVLADLGTDADHNPLAGAGFNRENFRAPESRVLAGDLKQIQRDLREASETFNSRKLQELMHNLGELGPAAAPLIPDIIKHYDLTQLGPVHVAALHAIAKIGVCDESVSNFLVRQLRAAEYPSERIAAAQALGALAVERGALAALEEVSNDRKEPFDNVKEASRNAFKAAEPRVSEHETNLLARRHLGSSEVWPPEPGLN